VDSIDDFNPENHADFGRHDLKCWIMFFGKGARLLKAGGFENRAGM